MRSLDGGGDPRPPKVRRERLGARRPLRGRRRVRHGQETGQRALPASSARAPFRGPPYFHSRVVRPRLRACGRYLQGPRGRAGPGARARGGGGGLRLVASRGDGRRVPRDELARVPRELRVGVAPRWRFLRGRRRVRHGQGAEQLRHGGRRRGGRLQGPGARRRRRRLPETPHRRVRRVPREHQRRRRKGGASISFFLTLFSHRRRARSRASRTARCRP